MSDPTKTVPAPASDALTAESRMRRALGLNGPTRAVPQQRADQARPRHRFVQDGGVPVVMLNSRSDLDPTAPLKARIAELEAALENERTARAADKRALHDAMAATQAAQTHLAHAEIAHKEALAQEQQARRQAEAALAQALTAPLPSAPEAAEPVAAEPSAAKSGAIELEAATAVPAAVKRRVVRTPRVAKPKEPQPVKWWLPGYRATDE